MGILAGDAISLRTIYGVLLEKTSLTYNGMARFPGGKTILKQSFGGAVFVCCAYVVILRHDTTFHANYAIGIIIVVVVFGVIVLVLLFWGYFIISNNNIYKYIGHEVLSAGLVLLSVLDTAIHQSSSLIRNEAERIVNQDKTSTLPFAAGIYSHCNWPGKVTVYIY